VFFVHGSPGSLNAFIHFLDDSVLYDKTLMITADRPGFGYSDFGHAEPSIEKQAALLKSIVEQYESNRPIILVGHSLGGPVIARMAMDFPELADGLIFVAASVDPDLEPKEGWFRIPLATPLFRWLLPRSFRASNDEIIPLKSELESMKPLWAKIKCPVIVIQGGNDSFVPEENAEFIRKMVTHSQVEIIIKNDMNHFVPWTNPELIRQSILMLLDQVSSQPLSGN
jgi:pimeloyl-ACP methyl ester carboxylesterase